MVIMYIVYIVLVILAMFFLYVFVRRESHIRPALEVGLIIDKNLEVMEEQMKILSLMNGFLIARQDGANEKFGVETNTITSLLSKIDKYCGELDPDLIIHGRDDEWFTINKVPNGPLFKYVKKVLAETHDKYDNYVRKYHDFIKQCSVVHGHDLSKRPYKQNIE